MKKYKLISLIFIIAVLILEIIPYGAVCNFMGDPETNTILRYTYSYFDLTPFGYANFGPFITAILSCVLAVLILVSNFSEKKMNNINILEIDRDDYVTKEDFANAVRDAVMVLLNNRYIMTIECVDNIVDINYNYADESYGGDYPRWLSPEEWENVVNNTEEEENE